MKNEKKIYCKSNGKYYPKYKTINGLNYVLDKSHFIYVLKGDNINESLKRTVVSDNDNGEEFENLPFNWTEEL